MSIFLACSRPEDGLRCRQGVKPPLNQPTNPTRRLYLYIGSYVILAATCEYHGIYIHIGDESYFKVGARFATSLPLRRFMIPSPFPDSWRLLDHSGSGKVQPSSPSQPSPSRFPLGGFRSPTSAPVSYFWSPQVFPERPVNIGKVIPLKVPICRNNVMHSLLMPPGKKTKKTLACVFAGANVLGTGKRDNRLVLIYRLLWLLG